MGKAGSTELIIQPSAISYEPSGKADSSPLKQFGMTRLTHRSELTDNIFAGAP
jgi:hypothetical protein